MSVVEPPPDPGLCLFMGTTKRRGTAENPSVHHDEPSSVIGTRIRYFTGRPASCAGRNFQALAAATIIRSWNLVVGDVSVSDSTSPSVSTMKSRYPVSALGAG